MTSDFYPPEVIQSLLGIGGKSPSVALVLGSGLGRFAAEIQNSRRVEARDIPGYPVSTVEGHAGSLVFGSISHNERRSPELLVFQGRVHYYESGDISTAVAPVRLAHALGARTIILTNATGGIDTSLRPGDLMVLDDLLSLNPLRLTSDTSAQLRYVTESFDVQLTSLLQDISVQIGIQLKHGTYAWVHGPSYETAAEISMLRIMGAHAVGMSTVPETYEARRLGMRVVGISLISNMGTGILPTKLSHSEVTTTAREASDKFARLLRMFLTHIDS